MSEHQSHKRHRNVLYSLVVVLVILQIVTFSVLSLQVSRLNVQMQTDLEDLTQEFEEQLIGYNEIYQTEFSDITNRLSSQEEEQEGFKEQIKLIKSTQEDFSGIIDDVVKGVVAVGTERSIGTGFILSNDGYVVTNYHVIDGASRVEILTYDKKVAKAVVVGADVMRDVALLKVEGSYDKLKLADSDVLQVGNKVIAIGNPLGLSFTVTEGIVSALDREGPNELEEYIQTDVSLNPGNSGGPLINTAGEVVGINNFKIGGGAEGLGFALESDSVEQAVNEIAGEQIV
tara:strand:+ start:4157 stop:5017 length:861 start_codon:yes stop_codon:yes gene_type:complete